MAIENCNFCRREGFHCTDTATLDEQKARIVVSKRGSQSLAFPCLRVCKVGKIADAVARALARTPMASKVEELVLA